MLKLVLLKEERKEINFRASVKIREERGGESIRLPLG
jgi:hypothetical protein